VNVETSLPYRLIDATATRSYRRQLGEILLPAAPPAITLAIALGLGLLPIELAAAAAIAAGIVMLYASGLAPSKIHAARFLDHSLGAKDHFLTLATAAGERDLLTVVEADAAAIASHASHEGPPRLPPARKRPLVTSLLLSLFAFALLWSLPRLSSLASTGGGGLEQIAAELAASGDDELARALGEVSRALRDPKLSNEEKRAKVDEALRKLDATERKQAAAAGSSGGGGQKGDPNQQQKGEQAKGRGEQGEGSGSQKQQAAGQGGGSGAARAKAKQELAKIAGELAGEAQQGKAEKGESAKQQQQPSGGGIQGPESGAEERKPGERESTGNQPGKNPDKPGGNQQPGGDQGASQAERGGENQPDQAGQAAKPGSGAGAEGQSAGQRSSSAADAKPAERYYKAGEGPDGTIVDGRYVRVRVPEENQQLPGSERVAKPGDASPQTPYGNAPLPPPGAPGEIGAEQPLPLEYRDAFKTGS
jgi:hypothetical protein